MNTFLLTWNPSRWQWHDLPKEANETAAGQTVAGRWSCGVTKKIQPGDRAFLMRLGVEPKGIIASGWVAKKSYPDEHWEFEKAEAGKRSLFVDCEWERLLDPKIDPPLTIINLQAGGLKNVHWTPQASGMENPTGAREGLEKLWAAHLGVSSLGAVYPDEEIAGFEGVGLTRIDGHPGRRGGNPRSR